MTKSELADGLGTGRDEVLTFFKSLPPEILNAPSTASEEPGGRAWSPKDHLAHLVQREQDFLAIAMRILARQANPLRLEYRGSSAEERNSFVNRENQAAIQRRERQHVDQLLQEFVALRSELILLVNGVAQDDLDREVEVDADRSVAASALLGSSDRHAKVHIQALLRSGVPTSEPGI